MALYTLKPFSSGVQCKKYTTTTPKLFSLRKSMTPKRRHCSSTKIQMTSTTTGYSSDNNDEEDTCNSCPLYVNDKESLDRILTCMNANSMSYYSYTTLHVLSFELEKEVKDNNKTINSWIFEDLRELDSLYYAFLLKTAYYGIILKVLFALQMKKSILICPSPLLPKTSIIRLCKFLSEKSLTLGAPGQCICWIDELKPDMMSALENYEGNKNIIVHCL
jgi:hypothetical protein